MSGVKKNEIWQYAIVLTALCIFGLLGKYLLRNFIFVPFEGLVIACLIFAIPLTILFYFLTKKLWSKFWRELKLSDIIFFFIVTLSISLFVLRYYVLLANIYLGINQSIEYDYSNKINVTPDIIKISFYDKNVSLGFAVDSEDFKKIKRVNGKIKVFKGSMGLYYLKLDKSL